MALTRLAGTNMSDRKDINLVELAAGIVSAYVSKNTVAVSDLPGLIRDVYGSLVLLSQPQAAPSAETLRPAVSPRKSIFDDHLICLEDGKKFKSLKRHLRSQYNLSPAQYREKWGLPADYPMVAPNYARARSRLARQMGLGQQRSKE
jgi:predicted transcriptional regulator